MNNNTRFAPSPTGFSLHIGNLRVALFSYLYAKKNNGKFILRIEDTDRNRYNKEAVNNIINALNYFNLIYDELYYQSDRLDIYQEYADLLVFKGLAYVDNNCIRLNLKDVDSIMGYVGYDSLRNKEFLNKNNLTDIVLLKSDGYPTYHLASVIDDHLMNIGVVFRGEEWLSTLPYHSYLYNCFGWDKPLFYHLPLIMSMDGKKLSKRDNSLSINYFIDRDYSKLAILNYIFRLGNSLPLDNEIYSIDKMIELFDVDKLSCSPVKFDINYLRNLNIKCYRSEDGKNEIYDTLAKKYSNYNIDELYILYCNGMNVLDELYYPIIEKYHTINNMNDRMLLLYSYLINILKQCNKVFLTDDDVKEIIDKLYKYSFTTKEIHVYIRLAIQNKEKGLPADVLLKLFKISDLIEIIDYACDDSVLQT
ncbi:MAG TPA: glutamate--tRNA ligase family protein [Bacteroidales bacterium]|nr:glutamate--tRNA ligase family protein [Bacteroidales bacterium]HRS69956.1 glutamate--tRNA ligase family protein [Bacteroidales bacterium]